MMRRLISRLRRPRLSVSIVTRDSEARLAQAIAQARSYADEVVVGVDAASVDGTWRQACELADAAYRFTHPNQLAPAHMLALGHCRGDWILRLDDDEFMEPGFADMLRELLDNANSCTHYYFPRKLVVSIDPPRYLHASPWYPNHVLRLFRNDPSLIWKPPRYHTGYFVAGRGQVESRCAILHFEHLWCTPEQRKKKILTYRSGGGNGVDEDYYAERAGEQRAFVMPVAKMARRAANGRIDEETRHLVVTALPAWGCRFDEVDMPNRIPAGCLMPIAMTLTNTGKMTWTSATSHWPVLSVVGRFHNDAVARPIFDGGRLPMTGHVRPGASIRLTGAIRSPDAAGEYVLSWDMLSENECWFAQCASEPFRAPILVTAARE